MEPGATFAGWEIQKLLGSGTFGCVYWLKNEDKNIALKMCRWRHDVIQPKLKQRWNLEVQSLNTIDHCNIVKATPIPDELCKSLNSHNVSKLRILCMEYCNGGSLRALLNKPENINGLKENQIRRLLSDIKNAVSHLHQLEITHKDLKPDNIVLHYDNCNWIYKLTDVGCLKEIDSDSVCPNLSGTLQYLAPELFYSKTFNHTVDYWSFGLIAFEAICGIRPFLPNMAPVQWMTHVKTKSSDQIYIYEKLNDEITYSNEIAIENRISSCLKTLLEKWFCRMLEWDPQKRGQNTDNNVFDHLQQILDKKIITIFSFSTYELLSYEIDDNLLFKTLQTWIERDTKINVDDQIFIYSLEQCEIDPEGFVHKYWNNQSEIMLYLYKKDKLIESSKCKVSPKIKSCLENPKMNLNYFQFITVMSYIHYFINNEKTLYETFIKSIILRLEYVRSFIDKLKIYKNESETKISQLESKKSLLNTIISSETDNIDKYSSTISTKYINLIKTWISQGNSLNNDISKLKEAWNQLNARLESVLRRNNEIQENEIYSKHINCEFIELLQSIQNHIVTASNIPVSDRKLEKSCFNVVKLLYKCLKVRENLIYNVDDHKIAQISADIHLESRKINNLFGIVSKNVDSLSNAIDKMIVEKQDLVWKAFSEAEDNNESNKTKNESHKFISLTNFKIGEPVRSPVPISPEISALELHSLINDNIRLRQESSDFIKNSHKMHLDIKDELYEELNAMKI